MIKLLASVRELETERLRPSFFRLPVVPALRVRLGRVQQPKRQVVLRLAGLCVCRLGLPGERQVHPQNMEWTLLLEVPCACRVGAGWRRRRAGPEFDLELPAQIRLSVSPLEAASRPESPWARQPAESLRVAHPVFLCALFRALPEMVKPERLLAQTLARPCRLAEVPDRFCPFAYLALMVTLKSRAPLKSSGLRRSRADRPRRLAAECSSGSRS